MTYVKWESNANPLDGVTKLILEDGSEIEMGVPVNLEASLRKELEADGRVFVDSSASESKEAAKAKAVEVPSDVATSEPDLDVPQDQTDQGPEPRKNK